MEVIIPTPTKYRICEDQMSDGTTRFMAEVLSEPIGWLPLGMTYFSKEEALSAISRHKESYVRVVKTTYHDME